MFNQSDSTAGGRRDVAMSQQVSQTVQEQIDELVQRTWEKKGRRRRRHFWLVKPPAPARDVHQNLIEVKRPPPL